MRAETIDWLERQLAKRWVHALLVVLLSVPYLWHLETSSIWDSNEAFYTETPREMLEHGTWIVPTFNYQFRMNKPPLSYWLVGMAYQFLGVHVFAQRLVIALFALATLLVVWQLARHLYGGRLPAWTATAVMALTPRFYFMSRRAVIEIVLLFFLTATFYFFLRFYEDRRKRWLLFFYLSLGLGFLGKGPVALALAGLVIGAFLLIRRDFKCLLQMQLLPGAILFGVVVLPWYLAVYSFFGPDFIRRLLLTENVLRYTTADFGPDRGPLYYLPIFLLDFFPWSALLLSGLGPLRRLWAGLADHPRAWQLFLLLWLVAPVVFFSLSKNKQEYYIMPAYLAGALLLGGLPRSLAACPEWWRVFKWVLGIVLAGCGLIALFAAFLLHTILGWTAFAVALALVVLAIQALGLRQLGRPRWEASLAAPFVTLYLVAWLATFLVIPAVERFRPVPEMAEIILSRAGVHDQVGYFVQATPSLCFYTRRPILELFAEEELLFHFRRPFRFYCLMRREHLRLLDRAGIPYDILVERPLMETRLKQILNFQSDAQRNALCLVVSRPR